MESVDIVNLIESNPITKLRNSYRGNLLMKIKSQLSDTEQQFFVTNFYCNLNYNANTDFVVDLDNMWQWLGFSTKQKAKMLLEKLFVLNKDYTKYHLQINNQKGGQNRETFMMTVRAFQLFCLKAGTKKAYEMREYYVKLNQILQDVIREESDELTIQLDRKNFELDQTKQELEKKTILYEIEKQEIREKTILDHFPVNIQCVYYGIIDNLSNTNEPLIKFGNSNNLKYRVKKHRSTYLNFRLINAFKVDNKLQIEKAIKDDPIFMARLRTITWRSKNYVEILSMTDFTFEELDSLIKNIIKGIDYNPKNFIKILEENKLLKNQLEIISKNEAETVDKNLDDEDDDEDDDDYKIEG